MPTYAEIVRKDGEIIITTGELSLSNKAFINLSAVDGTGTSGLVDIKGTRFIGWDVAIIN